MSDEDSDGPFDPEAMLSKMDKVAIRKSEFGIFFDVIEDYRNVSQTTRTDRLDHSSIHKMVCPNGQPATEVGGHPLDWRTGLTSIFSEDRSDVLAEISAHHEDAMIELFGLWSFNEGEPAFEPMYDFDRPVRNPSSPEMKLAPALPIADRTRLSDFYINTVLKPYERAQSACRKILWSHLKRAHLVGEWVGFRPTQTGSFVPILPGAGFDSQGQYRVSRKTYAAGFRYSDDQVSQILYGQGDDYRDQDSWIFLCTANLLALQPSKKASSQSDLAKAIAKAEKWMSRVGGKFAQQGRKVTSADVKAEAMKKFDLSQNAVNEAWKRARFSNKDVRGAVPQNKRVNINEIRDIN